MDSKNPENFCQDEEINEHKFISSLTTDKSITQTSSISSECVRIGGTSDGSCRADLSNESKVKDKVCCASESFDSAIGDDNLNFQNSPSFHTDLMRDQSTSDMVSVSSISTDLMMTSDEESTMRQTEQSTLKNVSFSQTLPSCSKMIVEEPVKAENLPYFSVVEPRDCRSVHRVLSPAGEALASSFLTDSVLLSPSTSPETFPRVLALASHSIEVSDSEDSDLTEKNKTNEASNRYERNLRKFLKDMEPENRTNKGNNSKISSLVEYQPNELVTTKPFGSYGSKSSTTKCCNYTERPALERLEASVPEKTSSSGTDFSCIESINLKHSTNSDQESNVKEGTSSTPLKKEDIPPHDVNETKTDLDRHMSLTATLTPVASNLQSKERSFCSPNEVLSVFKVPDSPMFSGKLVKCYKNSKSPGISPDIQQNCETSVVKKAKRPTSLHLSPRTSFYDFCPSSSGSILRLSRSLPDMRQMPKKEDRRLSANIELQKDNRCIKALFAENVELQAVSPNHLVSPSNTEPAQMQIASIQPDALEEIGKSSSEEQLSAKTQPPITDKLPSYDKIKARKKLTFALDSSKNTEDSAVEVKVSLQDHPKSISKVESEFSHSQRQVGSDSDVSESPSLQASSLSTTDTSNILKSETKETIAEKWPVARISTFECLHSKRKSSSPEIEFPDNPIPKKTRLTELHNTKGNAISSLSDSDSEGSREQNRPTDRAFMSTEDNLDSSEVSGQERSPITDTCMSDSTRANESDN